MQRGAHRALAAPNRLGAVAMAQMAVDEFADQRFADLSEVQLSAMQPDREMLETGTRSSSIVCWA